MALAAREKNQANEIHVDIIILRMCQQRTVMPERHRMMTYLQTA